MTNCNAVSNLIFLWGLPQDIFWEFWAVVIISIILWRQNADDNSKTNAARTFLEIKSIIQSKLTVFESYLINRTITKTIIDEKKEISRTHEKKLRRLGIHAHFQLFNPNKAVHNFSSMKLPERIKIILALGLDFNLPVWKPSQRSFYTSLKNMVHDLSKEQ